MSRTSKRKTRKVTRKPAPAEFGPRAYFEQSRELLTSMILVLPLFVLYQVGVLATDGVRNGVDFVSSLMWLAAGEDRVIYLGINAAFLVAFCVGIAVVRRRGGTFEPRIFPYVVVESTLYASVFGAVVLQIMTALGFGGLLASGANGAEFTALQKVVLSLGAGVYEELVFRLVGTGGIFWFLERFARDLPRWISALIAVALSSLIFSAIHHIGALGDPFTLGVFLFRFFAGALLAVIYWTRGFAVAVYTHAIYDIIVMLGR
jgi:hypothetical protein